MQLQSIRDDFRASGVDDTQRPGWSPTPGVRRQVRMFAVSVLSARSGSVLRTGAAIVLVGRSAAHEPAVAATLARARAADIRWAAVTDPEALASAASRAGRQFGAITALVHAADFNESCMFQHSDDPSPLAIMASKTVGLRAAVRAAGAQLRRVVTVGRIGLKGERHYALANTWQSRIAEDVARARPECRVLSLEWSITEPARDTGGVRWTRWRAPDTIALDDGVEAFERLVIGGATRFLIVTSRCGPPSYVALCGGDLPPLPFADEVLLHYPGLELVVGLELSRDCIGGRKVFTGALGIEAMAQLACALSARPVVLGAAELGEPIAVSERGTVRLYRMALVGLDRDIDVVIRSDTDGLATDRMRASLSVGATVSAAPPSAEISIAKNPLVTAGMSSESGAQ
jgi:enediyne polyketide synthase